jgi:hypothetical protein
MYPTVFPQLLKAWQFRAILSLQQLRRRAVLKPSSRLSTGVLQLISISVSPLIVRRDW